MAECKARLIADDEHYNDEKAFITKKQYPRYGSSNYSDATPLDIHPEFFIQHHVTESDTLNSIALKYGLKASTIKITNRLWNDNIFLCKQLLIPVINITDYDSKGYTILSKRDIIKGISKSKSVGYFEPHRNEFSTQHKRYNPDPNASNEDEEGDEEEEEEEEERLDNIDCLKSYNISEVSAQDYFKKFDSSLAKIKKNVEKLEKQNRSPKKRDPTTARQHTLPEGSGVAGDVVSDSGFLRFGGKRGGEEKMRQRFEQIENEMFQL